MTKQKQMIAIAASAIVILLVVALVLFKRGGDASATDATAAADSAATPVQKPLTPSGAGGIGAAGAGQTAMNPAGNPGKPVRPAPGKRDPFAAPGQAAAAGGMNGGAAARTASGPPTRPPGVASDPFLVTWKQKPLPPYVFDQVQPIRLASAVVETPPPPGYEVREVATRRVSGIMSGDGIYAILEGNGDPEIVKPGSVTRDGYRVVSITDASVRLQKKDRNVTLVQVVPLTDAAAGGAQTASFGGGQGGPNLGGAPRAGGGAKGGGAAPGVE